MIVSKFVIQFLIKMSANPAKKRRTRSTAKDEKAIEPVLPAEMFDLVIGHMDVTELIVCRAVCKYFKQMVDRIKIQDLAIAKSEDSVWKQVLEVRSYDYCFNKTVCYIRFSDQFYFVSNDPVYQSRTLIRPDTAAGLRILTNCFDLSELRRLFIVEVRNGEAHFDLLNRLTQLEHLQIGGIILNCSLMLKLPNLRTLSVSRVNCLTGGSKIRLITPNLKNFETRRLKGSIFEFDYRLSVTLVKVGSLDADELFQLENLEVLICERANQVVWFNDDLESGDEGYETTLNLNNYPNLRRIDVGRMNCKEAFAIDTLCANNNVDLYYCGRRIDHFEWEIRNIVKGGGRKGSVRLLTTADLFGAYDKLADAMYYCEGIRYWKCFDTFFPKKIPEDFASKFYLVRDVYVARKIENVDRFIEFLRCFKCLKVLWLNCSFLTQDFYDRHSHLFARLQEFTYRHYSKRVHHQPFVIDLKFILNLKFLEKFFTNQSIRMALICDAFNNLKYLKRFWVEDFLDFRIRLSETREFEVKCFDFKRPCPMHKFSSKAEMLKFVEEHFPALSASSD